MVQLALFAQVYAESVHPDHNHVAIHECMARWQQDFRVAALSCSTAVGKAIHPYREVYQPVTALNITDTQLADWAD